MDTGATYWVSNTQQSRMTKAKCKIVGVEGKPQEHNSTEHLSAIWKRKCYLTLSFMSQNAQFL